MSRDAGVVWTVLALYLLAALSPGPNVVLIIQTAATRPRAEAVGRGAGRCDRFVSPRRARRPRLAATARPPGRGAGSASDLCGLSGVSRHQDVVLGRPSPARTPYRHRWRRRDVSTRSDDDPDQPEGGGVLRDNLHRGHSPQHVLGGTGGVCRRHRRCLGRLALLAGVDGIRTASEGVLRSREANRRPCSRQRDDHLWDPAPRLLTSEGTPCRYS